MEKSRQRKEDLTMHNNDQPLLDDLSDDDEFNGKSIINVFNLERLKTLYLVLKSNFVLSLILNLSINYLLI